MEKVLNNKWLKIGLLSAAGLLLAGGLVFAGMQIGKQQAIRDTQYAIRISPIPSPLVSPILTFPPETTFSPLPSEAPAKESDETAGWKSYRNNKNLFSFKYPDYFKYLSENQDGNGVYLAPSEGTGEGKGSPFGLDLTKDSWLSASATKLDSAGLKYWQNKLSNSNITVSGIGGYKSQVVSEGATEPTYGHEVVILKDEILYKLDLLAANKELGFLSEKEKIFDLMLSTFKFLD